MEITRSPFQGVLNIIHFNWHFFVLAGIGVSIALLGNGLFPVAWQGWVFWGGLLGAATTFISLLVSYYIYDVSDFYHFNWLSLPPQQTVLTINAGFDETSALIQQKYQPQQLVIADFYDPALHTEVSIQRARKAFPPAASTLVVNSQQLPFANQSFDTVFCILAAHEIRNTEERIQFFKELARVTQPSGQIIITEHLRDWKNFLAYTVGFLHFYSKATWLATFEGAGLILEQEIKTTPFISTFILQTHGTTL